MSDMAKMRYGNVNVSVQRLDNIQPAKTDGISQIITKVNSRKLNMKVIALAGCAGSGKDTVANIIQELNHNKAVSYSFATPLKKAASILLNLDPWYFEPDNPDREKVHPKWGKSPRNMLKIITASSKMPK